MTGCVALRKDVYYVRLTYRFLGDHICIFGVRVLTTSLTIVRCGLRGDSSTREHENVRFS